MRAASQTLPRGLALTEDLLLIRDALVARLDLPDASMPVCYIEETEGGLRVTVEVIAG